MTLPDVFIEQGKPEQMYEQAGLNAAQIVVTALNALGLENRMPLRAELATPVVPKLV
jgi:1-deoxy-D-xylulose-5-phosphate synthase